MKKVVTISINQAVFNVEEDAYKVLKEYLESIHSYFEKQKGGAEITVDIESRIAELFGDRVKYGALEAISLREVEEIIGIMGRPEDFDIPESEEEDEFAEEKAAADPQPQPAKTTVKRKLYRDIDNKIVGGVASGLAEYFGITPLAMRLIMVALFFLVTGFPMVVVYVILWIIVKPALTAAQKLEMRGEAPTLENIKNYVQQGGESVQETIEAKKEKNFWGKFFKVVLIVLGCLILLPLVFIIAFPLVIVAVVMIFITLIMIFLIPVVIIAASLGGFDYGSLDMLPYALAGDWLSIAAAACVIFLPLIYLFYRMTGKRKPLFRTGWGWILLVLWLIAFFYMIFSIVSGLGTGMDMFPYGFDI